MGRYFNVGLIAIPVLVSGVMSVGCVQKESKRSPKVDTYVFKVEQDPTTNAPKIRNKDNKPGLYDGGNAYIRVQEDDKLKLVWEWDCPETITLTIHGMVNDEGKKPGKLSTKYQSGNPDDPETFVGQNSVSFDIADRNGKKGGEAYEYAIECGTLKVDPVIIIDRKK